MFAAQLPDQALVHNYLQGNESALAELINRHQQKVFTYIRMLVKDSQLAEDVVQETFLAVYRSRHTYNPTFAVSTWVWTILLNLVRRTRIRLATRQQHEAASLAVRSVQIPSNRDEDREQLDLWLSLIPEAEADALRLRFFGELSFEQIAASMESSVSGAKLRVRNGLERLSELARIEQKDSLGTDASSGEMR